MTSQLTPKQFRIASRTDRVRAEARLGVASDSSVKLRMALYGVQYALQTGRVWGDVAIKIQALSGYQYAKLVCEVANEGIMANDAAAYLSKRF